MSGHPYEQSEWSIGDACVAMVLRDGHGDQCGRPRAEHGVDAWAIYDLSDGRRIAAAVEAVLVERGVDYEAQRLRTIVPSVSLWIEALAADLRALARPTDEATP